MMNPPNCTACKRAFVFLPFGTWKQVKGIKCWFWQLLSLIFNMTWWVSRLQGGEAWVTGLKKLNKSKEQTWSHFYSQAMGLDFIYSCWNSTNQTMILHGAKLARVYSPYIIYAQSSDTKRWDGHTRVAEQKKLAHCLLRVWCDVLLPHKPTTFSLYLYVFKATYYLCVPYKATLSPYRIQDKIHCFGAKYCHCSKRN